MRSTQPSGGIRSGRHLVPLLLQKFQSSTQPAGPPAGLEPFDDGGIPEIEGKENRSLAEKLEAAREIWTAPESFPFATLKGQDATLNPKWIRLPWNRYSPVT
jgi:hypothetical protein